MSYNEIFNRPYFAVPPEAPQVQLLLDRVPRPGASGWHCDGPNNTVRFSIAIYFGSLIMHPDNASGREIELRRLFGFPVASTVRLDFACSHDALWLLRIGEPHSDPVAAIDLAPDAVQAAERFIADFLHLDLRTVLLERRMQDTEIDNLFRGEEVIYEGFLGNEGLPLDLARLDDSPFAVNGTIMATIL